MGRSPKSILGAMLLAWLAFALWQFLTWRHERDLIRETTQQQARTVMNALTGGIRSHRRLGRFVQMQLSGILEELAGTADVLSVEVMTDDGHRLVAAGEALDHASPLPPSGGYWEPSGFRLIQRFDIEPSPGFGGGFGLDREEDERFDQLRREGGVLAAVLLLDRSRADALLFGSIRSHAIAAITSALVFFGLGLAWWGNLRLVAERGRAELLEVEAQHYRDLSQSAAGLAHETRNPLGLIRGWAQRLSTSTDDAETRQQQARVLVEECDRVTARINEFLTFTRPYQPQIEMTSVIKLAEELRDILQPDLESKSIALEIHARDHSQLIRADRELLRQAMFNLLQNAIQASPPSEVVEVRVTVDPSNGGCLEISDRGPGVPEDQVASLFSPYFTTREGGTGLGLAIVRKIAFAHGWTASYKRRGDGGSTFSLEGLIVASQTNHPDC